MSQKEPFKWRKAKAAVPPPTPKAQPAPVRPVSVPAPAPAPAPVAPAAHARETPTPPTPVKGPERPAAEPAHDRIAARAYELWEAQGWPHGADREHWLEAERQLRAQPGSP